MLHSTTRLPCCRFNQALRPSDCCFSDRRAVPRYHCALLSITKRCRAALLPAGVLYSATIVPCPVTMAVVNVGPSEAKVESLFTEFLQLR